MVTWGRCRPAVRRCLLLATAALLAAAPRLAEAGKDTHRYKPGEEVVVWTDKVGPYNNPQETYTYHSLGVCELWGKDIHVQKGDLSIGDSLGGHEFFSSPRLKIHFGRETERTKVCSMKLSAEGARALSAKIHENYWYQLYIDDLPVWAFVGEHSKFGVDVSRFVKLARTKNTTSRDAQGPPPVPKHLKGRPLPRVYTHRHLTLFHNGDQLIEVDMEPSEPWPVYEGAPLTFTYSADWYSTRKPFVDRTKRYLDPKFFEHRVHWFAIVNSFVLCLLLCAVVAVILMKTLRRDILRYSSSDCEGLDSDESGWKQVSGDVFRRPEHLAAFTVVYATGCHLAVCASAVLVFAMANSYYAHRGATATSFIVSYLCTVVVGGFEGGRVFRMFGGTRWKRTMAYQCIFMPALLCADFVVVNTTAIVYRATTTVPFKTVAVIVVLFVVMCIPLHAVGTLLGRRAVPANPFPCRVHNLQRPIPMKHWLFAPGMIVVAGLVPFGCLFIEMYFILSAVWSHNKIYYVYGFVLAILLVLCLVLVCVSITCTYVLLNTEDYRWQWQSFLCCGSTAVYAFIYTVHYFFHSTQMTGFLQTVHYFSTSLISCICLGLCCGALGFAGASRFVFLIYNNIKAE